MKAWRGHLLLLVLIGGLTGMHALNHRNVSQLRGDLTGFLGTSKSSVNQLSSLALIADLHLLLNRPEPISTAEGQRITEILLASDDPLLREYALTTDLCRLTERSDDQIPEIQEQRVLGSNPLPLDGPWWREYVTYRRKVGGKQVGGRKRLDNLELGWYRQALRGEDPPREALFEHLVKRVRDAHVGPIPRGQ